MERDDNRFNILIVDDVAHNIQIIANILENAGYQTAYAMSGETALEQAQDFAYDLILLDIMMPGTDGYDTCRLLKKNPLTKEIPVIFITAKKDTDNVVMGFEIGAQDYITKPFQPAELLARVKTHLELKSAREKVWTVSCVMHLNSPGHVKPNMLPQRPSPMGSFTPCLTGTNALPPLLASIRTFGPISTTSIFSPLILSCIPIGSMWW